MCVKKQAANLILRILLAVVRALPLSALYAFALLLAWIMMALQVRTWRTVCANLNLVYPQLLEGARQKLARRAFLNQAKNVAESLKVWVMPHAWVLRQIDNVVGQVHFDNAINSGKGVLLILPHYGTWEMINAWVCAQKPTVIMYKPLKNAHLDGLVKLGRIDTGATLVPTDTTGVKAVLNTLKQGGISLVLPDHVPSSGGVIAPFFGIDALTATLAPKLANKTNCILLGITCTRTDTGFTIKCTPLDDGELYDKDLTVATTAMNRAVQSLIDDSAHYMWGYKRFRGTNTNYYQ